MPMRADMNSATVSSTMPSAHQNSTENALGASSTIRSALAVLCTFEPDTIVHTMMPSVIISTDAYLDGA